MFILHYSVFLSKLRRKQNRNLKSHRCVFVFFSLTRSWFLDLFAAYKLNLLMLQCIFVECLDCDCVSSYTSVSGVYEITSPVTNNSTQVECVMKDGHGYTVNTAKVLVYKFCLCRHNICFQTGCTVLFKSKIYEIYLLF